MSGMSIPIRISETLIHVFPWSIPRDLLTSGGSWDAQPPRSHVPSGSPTLTGAAWQLWLSQWRPSSTYVGYAGWKVEYLFPKKKHQPGGQVCVFSGGDNGLWCPHDQSFESLTTDLLFHSSPEKRKRTKSNSEVQVGMGVGYSKWVETGTRVSSPFQEPICWCYHHYKHTHTHIYIYTHTYIYIYIGAM